MVDLNAHEAGNGGKKPREAYSLPSLLYSEAARFQQHRRRLEKGILAHSWRAATDYPKADLH
jgi:hypothetical protein